ncbi:histidine--tRNA ligase [Natranaerobius trueperi]|uniref:Histidine--tRNA ligase n=1 Tax=Natranaerobius trueperi TaxID=759412 RepID=A0A226BZU1_9FIRM|nr:histidine--tRNA ligase [Natranaerobius trueperi]OWZ83617.1 histidine--tRNA ligase [Natranaerobius trueperi]
MLTKAPRGTKDILPEENLKWNFLEKTAQKVAERFGFQQIRFPIFEHTELFQRSVGETSDIVSKEMYTFTDRGSRSITLRPEGTAPTVRMYVEYKLFNQPQPTKFYYTGPMFRYDRPQAGRYRQFHQFGVELFGSEAPEADVEVMKLALDYFTALGLDGLELEINSVGCKKCREEYINTLVKYFESKIEMLCEDCNNRFRTNPMRVLDCKQKGCQDAVDEDVPFITDNLCSECDNHFENVKKLLSGLDIDYRINRHLVRGLDYYTKTAFEVVSSSIGAQNALGGGGRYDYLVEECGGPATPGVGFAVGLERILLALDKQNVDLPKADTYDIFIVTASKETTHYKSFNLLHKLRDEGFSAIMDYDGRSLRAQMKRANKLGVRYSLILGDEELQEGICQLKDMESGTQQSIPLDDLIERLTEIIN